MYEIVLINERGESSMFFRVIIKNGANCEIYNEIVHAKDENEAIERVLESETIYSGDIISIELE